jgi:hypothetical protein
MKTRYKILIVIAIFTVFFFIRMPIADVCHVFSEDKSDCEPLRKFVFDTSPVIHGSEGIGSWTGTGQKMESQFMPFLLYDSVNFIIIFLIVPISIILGIYYKDKRK